MLAKFTRATLAPLALSTLFATGVFAQTGANPALTVITPSEGQTLYGQKVPILIDTENHEIVDYQTNTKKVTGQGHVHLWLDEENPTPESAVKLTTDEFTYSDVAYGDHTLKAQLVTNDHFPLKPAVTSTVNFKTAPVATPSPVATAGFDKNTALVIFIVVALVILAAWWYTKEDEDEMPSEEAKTKKPQKRKVTKKSASKRKK